MYGGGIIWPESGDCTCASDDSSSRERQTCSKGTKGAGIRDLRSSDMKAAAEKELRLRRSRCVGRYNILGGSSRIGGDQRT